MKHRLYLVTRRTTMQGETVVGIYRDYDVATLHYETVKVWGNALPDMHIMDGPWWWWFRGPRFLTARIREEFSFLNWDD